MGNFAGMSQRMRVGQKFSSPEFTVGATGASVAPALTPAGESRWFMDLYPAGYKDGDFVAVSRYPRRPRSLLAVVPALVQVCSCVSAASFFALLI